MTVTVQQLANQMRNANPTPDWVYPLLDRAFRKQNVPPKVLHELLWSVEAAKSDSPDVLYMTVLDCNPGFDAFSIASWLQSDVKNRLKYFDNPGYAMSGVDMFQYAFARWKNEIGNSLVDELIKERNRQSAGQSS